MKFITSLKDLETYLGVSITKDILIKGISTDTNAAYYSDHDIISLYISKE